MNSRPILDGRFIVDCRETLHLPKSALADAMGVSDRVLRTIEAGEPVPYLPLLEVVRLADALGVPVARLFPGGRPATYRADDNQQGMSLVRALVLARGGPLHKQAIIDGLRLTPADLDVEHVLEGPRSVLHLIGLTLRVTHDKVQLIPGQLDDPAAEAVLNAGALRSLSALQIEIVLHSLHRVKTQKALLHSARTGPATQGLVKAGILTPPEKETSYFEVNDEVRYGLMLDGNS